MRFSLPLYDGDSFLRPGPSLKSDCGGAQEKTDSNRDMVRRINDSFADVVPSGATDANSRAERLRARVILRLASLLQLVGLHLERARRHRDEAELISAQALSELEQRQRRIDPQGKLLRA